MTINLSAVNDGNKGFADASLLRLMQLSSVSLPIGGYAFSQGMEYAIDIGWIKNQNAVADWIRLQLSESIARIDLPILQRAMQACQTENWTYLQELNDLALACRETKELRLTDTAMGEALKRLLKNLGFDEELKAFLGEEFKQSDEVSFVCLFALAAQTWNISYPMAALGFCWSWLENQVAAATKLVPLGQTQSQHLLSELQQDIPPAISLADTIEEDDIGASLPTIAIASARHEEQYSRLFRS